MKFNATMKWFTLVCAIAMLGLFPAMSSAQGYDSLKGLDSVKVVFDFRNGAPKSALAYLKLIELTYKDKAITGLAHKPEFVVVFMGKAVKLLSTDRKGFSAEDTKTVEAIANQIASMSKEGIRLEICMFAAKHFGVGPQSIIPGIHPVENGWIASAGYQAKGYSLIPVF